jgi:hypothetical protein
LSKSTQKDRGFVNFNKRLGLCCKEKMFIFVVK